jgi:hypothetical protein
MIRFCKLGLAFALVSSSLLAQDAAPETAASPDTANAFTLNVNYDRPGLLVPHWQITVPARGMAEYTGKPTKGNDPGQVLFRMSDAGHAKLGTLLDKTHNLQPCETHSKGIANMGTKVIDYTPAGGAPVHCTFNFTDNKALSEALDYLLAIAGTLQAGAELDRLHRYDRLGLDPVMIRLSEDAKQGRAVELNAIKPTLESLATDVAVLERVRTRAQQLLDLAKQQEHTTP